MHVVLYSWNPVRHLGVLECQYCFGDLPALSNPIQMVKYPSKKVGGWVSRKHTEHILIFCSCISDCDQSSASYLPEWLIALLVGGLMAVILVVIVVVSLIHRHRTRWIQTSSMESLHNIITEVEISKRDNNNFLMT